MAMPDAALKVSEIYREAGYAFNKLSEMTASMDPAGDLPQGSKWTDVEIEMLRACLHQFALDLNKISMRIKNRAISRIEKAMRKKAYEDAGMSVRDVSGPMTSAAAAQLHNTLEVRAHAATSDKPIPGKNEAVQNSKNYLNFHKMCQWSRGIRNTPREKPRRRILMPAAQDRCIREYTLSWSLRLTSLWKS